MYGDNAENVFYYLTIYNEPVQQPAEPEHLDARPAARPVPLRHAPGGTAAGGRRSWSPASPCPTP